jgi:altronate dehydratase
MTSAREPTDSQHAPRCLRLDPRDNVAVAVVNLSKDQTMSIGGTEFVLHEAIPFGHKVAITSIVRGGTIVKYGECIGLAACDIGAGFHVHVHNVVSFRLPGGSSDS